MGTIVDLTNLTTKLIESVQDRKFAGELREIQRMIGALQSEHATILESRIAVMTENAELKQKVATLELRLAETEKNLLRKREAADEFVEHRGALFKRRPGGEFHNAVYCPKCRKSTSSLQGELPYHCSCGWNADFDGRAMKMVLKELSDTL